MTSETAPNTDRGYVWVWLPGTAAPVVAGLQRRDARGGEVSFRGGDEALDFAVKRSNPRFFECEFYGVE